MAAAAPRRGLMALWKQGWNEIPEVLASCGLGMFGIVLGTVGVYKYYARDGDNKRYKETFVIMRSSDPRVAKIRKD